MSVVAVRVNEKSIIMSADSIIVHGWADKKSVGRGKIFDINGMLIGSSGDAAEMVFLTIFAENHKPVTMTERGIVEFMNEFATWKNKQCNDPDPVRNQYLIAANGKCFYIGGHFVGEVLDYYAIGAGEEYAKAALYLGHSTQEAVKAACELCCYVSEPIVTLSQER